MNLINQNKTYETEKKDSKLTVPAAVLEDKKVFAFNRERPKSQTCSITRLFWLKEAPTKHSACGGGGRNPRSLNKEAPTEDVTVDR